MDHLKKPSPTREKPTWLLRGTENIQPTLPFMTVCSSFIHIKRDIHVFCFFCLLLYSYHIAVLFVFTKYCVDHCCEFVSHKERRGLYL